MIKKFIPKSIKRKFNKSIKLFSSQTHPVMRSQLSENNILEEITTGIECLQITSSATNDHAVMEGFILAAEGDKIVKNEEKLISSCNDLSTKQSEPVQYLSILGDSVKIELQEPKKSRQSHHKKKIKSTKELHSSDKRFDKISNTCSRALSKSASVRNAHEKSKNRKLAEKSSVNLKHASHKNSHTKSQKIRSSGKYHNADPLKNPSLRRRVRKKKNMIVTEREKNNQSKL